MGQDTEDLGSPRQALSQSMNYFFTAQLRVNGSACRWSMDRVPSPSSGGVEDTAILNHREFVDYSTDPLSGGLPSTWRVGDVCMRKVIEASQHPTVSRQSEVACEAKGRRRSGRHASSTPASRRTRCYRKSSPERGPIRSAGDGNTHDLTSCCGRSRMCRTWELKKIRSPAIELTGIRSFRRLARLTYR